MMTISWKKKSNPLVRAPIRGLIFKDDNYALFSFKRYETGSVAYARYELDLIPGLPKCFTSIEN